MMWPNRIQADFDQLPLGSWHVALAEDSMEDVKEFIRR